jgi:hypothetical protein
MKTLRVITLVAFGVFIVAATARVTTADWSPESAARYLDQRQKQWFEWKPAASANGPCVSCHTGMTYLLARPVLRRALREDQPTVYERGLLDRLRSNVGAKPPGALQNVESIFAAMFLAQQGDRHEMSADTHQAFEQLWELQQNDGPVKGAWTWYSANLDPWEHAGSSYFGASLAMLAVGSTPMDYQQRADTRDRVAALTNYLSASSPGRFTIDSRSCGRPRRTPVRCPSLRAPRWSTRCSPNSRRMAVGPWSRSVRGRCTLTRHR